MRRLEGILGIDAVEWLGVIARAGVLITIVGFALAILGLLHA